MALAFIQYAICVGGNPAPKLTLPSNLSEFPLTAVYGDAGDRYVCRFVSVGVLFAQTPGLHFSALYGFSFHSMCYLHWWKSCSHSRLWQRYYSAMWMTRLDLQTLHGLYALCTKWGITFSNSQYPQLLVDVLLSLVQPLFRPRNRREYDSFHWRQYTVLQETAKFAGPSRFVRSLHRMMDTWLYLCITEL